MSLKSALVAAKQLSETFAALGEAEVVLTQAVKAEAMLLSQGKRLADIAAEVNAAESDKAKAQSDAASLRSEAKAALDDAKAAATQAILDAKAEAAAIKDTAKDDAKALLEVARTKLADTEGKTKLAEQRFAKFTNDADVAAAKLSTARETLAKMLE